MTYSCTLKSSTGGNVVDFDKTYAEGSGPRLDITNEIEDKFRDDLYNLELESGQIISTFIYSKNYWENRLIFSPLYRNVKREGIRL